MTVDPHTMLTKKKDVNLDKVIQLALTDSKILKEILKGIVSKKEVYRYNCFKVLLQISEDQPQILYPEWDYFIGLISSNNSYHRSASLNIIANLTTIDAEKRFENIFDEYFALLDDESMITARYLARNAGKIGKAKPDLQRKITERLLDIDKTHHVQGRKDLIKADIIQSFEEFFEVSQDREKILAFVEKQLESSSPKTRKMAKDFLKKYGRKKLKNST